jgi:hypothetical protein
MWIVDPDASERKRALGWEKGLENVVPIDKGLLDWIESGAPECYFLLVPYDISISVSYLNCRIHFSGGGVGGFK